MWKKESKPAPCFFNNPYSNWNSGTIFDFANLSTKFQLTKEDDTMMTQDKFAVQDILLEVKERLRQQALVIPMSKTSKELLEIKNLVSHALNIMAIQRDIEQANAIHGKCESTVCYGK